MCAGTSATKTPRAVMENARHQTQSCAALNVSEKALQNTTGSVMESVSQSGHPAMELALRAMLSAMVIVTLKRILTSICGIVEARVNALGRTNSVLGPVQMKDPNVETTCAFAARMIPSVMRAAKTLESVTAPASQIGVLVTRLASQDIISATTPTATQT